MRHARKRLHLSPVSRLHARRLVLPIKVAGQSPHVHPAAAVLQQHLGRPTSARTARLLPAAAAARRNDDESRDKGYKAEKTKEMMKELYETREKNNVNMDWKDWSFAAMREEYVR